MQLHTLIGLCFVALVGAKSSDNVATEDKGPGTNESESFGVNLISGSEAYEMNSSSPSSFSSASLSFGDSGDFEKVSLNQSGRPLLSILRSLGNVNKEDGPVSAGVNTSYEGDSRRLSDWVDPGNNNCCGGNGGSYFEKVCPSGAYVTSFYGIASRRHLWAGSQAPDTGGYSAYVTKFGVRCSNGADLGSLGGGSEDSAFGQFDVGSPEGFYAFYVESTNHVEYMEFWSPQRGRLATAGVPVRSPSIFESKEYMCHHMDCPDNKRILGVRLRMGAWMDKIHFPVCG